MVELPEILYEKTRVGEVLGQVYVSPLITPHVSAAVLFLSPIKSLWYIPQKKNL